MYTCDICLQSIAMHLPVAVPQKNIIEKQQFDEKSLLLGYTMFESPQLLIAYLWI